MTDIHLVFVLILFAIAIINANNYTILKNKWKLVSINNNTNISQTNSYHIIIDLNNNSATDHETIKEMHYRTIIKNENIAHKPNEILILQYLKVTEKDKLYILSDMKAIIKWVIKNIPFANVVEFECSQTHKLLSLLTHNCNNHALSS